MALICPIKPVRDAPSCISYYSVFFSSSAMSWLCNLLWQAANVDLWITRWQDAEVHRWWETFHMLPLATSQAAIQQKELPAVVHSLASSCEPAEAGRMLTGMKENQPRHAAIRQKAWPPISYDIHGRNDKRVIHQTWRKICFTGSCFQARFSSAYEHPEVISVADG